MKNKKIVYIILFCFLLVGGCAKNTVESDNIEPGGEGNMLEKEDNAPSVTPVGVHEVSVTPILTGELTPTSTPMPTSTPTPTPIVIEELDDSYIFSLMCDAEGKVKQMVNSGEIDGYVTGTSKFLVWKSASKNITALKEYKFALLDCMGNYESEFMNFEIQIEHPEYIKSLGDNIFQIYGKDSYLRCYNANEKQYFSYHQNCEIITDFSEGYALAYLWDTLAGESGSNYYYHDFVLINKFGEVIYTPLKLKFFTRNFDHCTVGKYGEGYFFLESAFYNINAEKVLDLGNVEVTNNPYFDHGSCRIEYEDAGAKWSAYIDIEGNFLAGPTKLYDLY